MTKSLSKAIALATLVGVSASAHAMNINQDGLGEVLLYSLYTTEEGNNTNIRITNTTEHAKAVKVRFVEGQNSHEVLDFNLYLSPYDQWSGAITQTEDGAKLLTRDLSCTAPTIPAGGQAFRDYDYKGKGGEQGLARTRVGHIEVIEMGVLNSELSALVTADHEVAGSAPADCAAINAKFKNPSDAWYDSVANSMPPKVTPDLQDGILTEINDERVTGGLYGSANIINVEDSTQIAYSAVAIDNFLSDSVHAWTGSNEPNLKSTQAFDVNFKNGKSATYQDGSEAVSALLMKESISNDFVLADALAAETNWVITFPTKRFHVDTDPASAPFVNGWKKTGTGADAIWGACHAVSMSYWDHEEYEPAGALGDIDFSPMPPQGEKPTTNICYETNILTFNESKVLGGEFVNYNVNLPAEYQQGWMNINFSESQVLTPVVGDAGTEEITGLPVIGFSATTIKNNSANQFNAVRNYGSSLEHKAKTTVDH